MIEILDKLDKQLFLKLNSLHHPFFDPIMLWFSHTWFWVPFYALIIVFLWYNLKKQIFISLIAIALIVTLTDRISSGFFKPNFQRLRPCHNEVLKDQIHLLEGCGGKYGYVSSHAANTFALAMFLWLSFRKKYKWTGFIFLWAFLVSYSRIYKGVHYPGDILSGAILGMIIAFFVYNLMILIQNRVVHKTMAK